MPRQSTLLLVSSATNFLCIAFGSIGASPSKPITTLPQGFFSRSHTSRSSASVPHDTHPLFLCLCSSFSQGSSSAWERRRDFSNITVTRMSNSGYNEFFNYMPQLVQEDGSSDEDEGLITVELKMPLLTDECEEKVQQKLKAIEGVVTVHIDVTRQKVTVKGTTEPATVLAKAKKAMPHTELWQQ